MSRFNKLSKKVNKLQSNIIDEYYKVTEYLDELVKIVCEIKELLEDYEDSGEDSDDESESEPETNNN